MDELEIINLQFILKIIYIWDLDMVINTTL